MRWKHKCFTWITTEHITYSRCFEIHTFAMYFLWLPFFVLINRQCETNKCVRRWILQSVQYRYKINLLNTTLEYLNKYDYFVAFAVLCLCCCWCCLYSFIYLVVDVDFKWNAASKHTKQLRKKVNHDLSIRPPPPLSLIVG